MSWTDAHVLFLIASLTLIPVASFFAMKSIDARRGSF